MEVLIDNKELSSTWGVHVLDWTEAFGVASVRDNSYTWEDKSGTDEALVNRRYSSREFSMSCFNKSANVIEAREAIAGLIEYLFTQVNVVLSFRHSSGKRYAMLCHRSSPITGDGINVRKQNTLFVFDIALKEVNPNALKYYTTVQSGLISVDYTKGRNAVIYWGDGSRGVVSNSQVYTLPSTLPTGSLVEVIVDIDKDIPTVAGMVADFTYVVPTGIVPDTVQFTDTSTGSPALWSWDFGDGTASIEQNPAHTYTSDGVFSVRLQVFNTAQGTSSITKTNIIILRRGRRLKDSTGGFRKISTTNYRLKS